MTEVYPSSVYVPIQASTFEYDPKSHHVQCSIYPSDHHTYVAWLSLHSLHRAFCKCIYVSVQSSQILPVI